MPHGYTIKLDSGPQPGESANTEKTYGETPLPFSGSPVKPVKQEIPEQLRKMRRLYRYGRETMETRADNFYRQGVFMQDFEDDFPWAGDFICYFPTYQDMTTRQLRGYFSWRAKVRKGEYHPISVSAAYLYIYELLNGIGASSPEEALKKLEEFETEFLDQGFGDQRMRPNLRRWMLDLSVICGLAPDTALRYLDPELRQRDLALTVLRHPSGYTDVEVFAALCLFGGQKYGQSPVLEADPARGMHLFSDAWRCAAAGYRDQDQDLFTLCFGTGFCRKWYPLANAVYHWKDRPADRVYTLNESRSYRCSEGMWEVCSFEKIYFDLDRFKGFLRETDCVLRRYLKTGRYLREKNADAWALPYINMAVEGDKAAVLEASRPKVVLDLSGLDRIRRDALTTQNSLLTEDSEVQLSEETEVLPAGDDNVPLMEDNTPLMEELPDVPLDPVQIRILRTLLSGGSADEIIRANHLMPSIVADRINEALFDEIGDTALSCDDDRLSLVEDYIEDLSQILGGT